MAVRSCWLAVRRAVAPRQRPADEPLEHAVVGALIEQYSGDGEADRDTLALITSAPALQAEFLDTIAAIERPLAEAATASAAVPADLGLAEHDPAGGVEGGQQMHPRKVSSSRARSGRPGRNP
jgi:hypothetical protein